MFSKQYILKHYDTIITKENIIEKRKETDSISKEQMIKEHSILKEQCKSYHLPFIEIHKDYEHEIQAITL
ncbi:hypothetical protein LS80_004025 [Helicobacter trogontum]|uniref:Uncharacterized protein n=1 Tax=Helicobacter trogontum TaxID=50960 RepID=A0A4U8TF11_9HELI|nr:hypothetical protein LS80_004025 [Helicobacter trogontum]